VRVAIIGSGFAGLAESYELVARRAQIPAEGARAAVG